MSTLSEIKELAQKAFEAAKEARYDQIRPLVTAINELDLDLLNRAGKAKTAVQFVRIA